MRSDAKIARLTDSLLLKKAYQEGDDNSNPAALPDSSLDFLIALAREVEATSVFEFGSGRSTAAFLQQGLNVTSLEDNAYWMEQTRKNLSDSDLARHTALVQPLQRRFHGSFPVMDWSLTSELEASLKKADLVLIDSPYYVPFRESTLWTVLNLAPSAVIILDDVRIPTASRFCDRTVNTNPQLWHRRIPVGHTFDLFIRPEGSPLHLQQSLMEILRGCRRFLLAKK